MKGGFRGAVVANGGQESRESTMAASGRIWRAAAKTQAARRVCMVNASLTHDVFTVPPRGKTGQAVNEAATNRQNRGGEAKG